MASGCCPTAHRGSSRVYTDGTPGRWAHQNAQAAYVEWQRFGLDVSFEVGEAGQLRIEYRRL